MNLYFSLSFIEQRNNDFIIRITKRGHGGPHTDLREKKKHLWDHHSNDFIKRFHFTFCDVSGYLISRF